ncbi:MAG: hypothetical protein ACYC3I_04020 [Gemmataceae bacterium]
MAITATVGDAGQTARLEDRFQDVRIAAGVLDVGNVWGELLEDLGHFFGIAAARNARVAHLLRQVVQLGHLLPTRRVVN